MPDGERALRRDRNFLLFVALQAVSFAARTPLVVDGVFLQRPQLRPLWTLVVYLDIPAEETLRRARVRDVARFGSVAEVERRYRARYVPAQELYRAEARPLESADVVIENGRSARIVKLCRRVV